MNGLRWMSDESDEYYLPMNVNTNMENFLKEMQELSFFQLSNIKNKFGNVLDLVFVNELGDVEVAVDKSKIIGAIQQDVAHVPYEISLEYCEKQTSMNCIEKEIICYKIGDYKRVMEELDRINFTSEFNERDVDSAFDFFYSTINRLVESNVPTKKIFVNLNKPEWWTKKLQQLKNRRDKLYKRNRNGTEYAAVLTEFDELSSILFDQYIDDVQDESETDPAAFWKFAKLNGKSSSYPSEMQFKERNGQSPDEIVELFAEFFEKNYVAD